MVFSSTILIILSPIFLTISLVIFVADGFPIIYKGKRAGIFNTDLYIFKFRTMVKGADTIGGPSTALADPRLLSFGRFLRKYKLDELPQFFNVLLGQMSIVGPRPQVRVYTDQYNKSEKRILNVKPGITDLASLYFHDLDSILGQENVDKFYRENIEPKKNKLRLYYADNVSTSLNLHIIFSTFLTLFFNKTTKKVENLITKIINT